MGFVRTPFVFCLALLITVCGSLVNSLSIDAAPSAIKVLTLDNRPPNYLMLKQIAAIAGVYLDISLGNEIPNSDIVDLTDFDLISLNAAVAGSLVSSRTVDPWLLQPILINSQTLVHFTVPRAQPTVTDSSVKAEYDKVIRSLEKLKTQKLIIAVLNGKAESTGDVFLDTYADRLLGWLDFLAKAGLDPDRFLITLDDNRPGPLADCLKLKLRKYSHHVMDGTDEGMMLLLARYLREHQPNTPNTLGLVWTAPGDLLAISPAESAFVVENLLAELDWLKVRVTSRLDMLEPWRPVLWVSGVGEKEVEGRKEKIKDVVGNLGDKRVVVADISSPGGGDWALMDAWREIGPPSGLVGYLAWNTSSNSLGSAVALWVALDYGYAIRSDPWSISTATEAFLWARLLDDWLYQSVVRAKVRDKYVLLGTNQWDMTEDEAYNATSDIANYLVEEWHKMGIDMSVPLKIVKPLTETSFVVELPWRRFFEINLFPTDQRDWIPQISPYTKN
jgi:hypothetical protein